MASVLFAFLLIALVDLIPLIRRRSGRGIIAFLLLFALGLTISILEISGVKVPSIMIILGDVLKSMRMSY